MTDENDWRSRRAAELFSTPFERPKPANRIDDILPGLNAAQEPLTTTAATSSRPFRSSSPVPPTVVTRSAPNTVPRTTKPASPVPSAILYAANAAPSRGILAPLVAIGLVVLALIAAGWAFLDRRTSAPVFVPPGLPITAPIARVPPAGLPRITAMPVASPVSPVIKVEPMPSVLATMDPARVAPPHASHSATSGKVDAAKITRPYIRSLPAKTKLKPHTHRPASPIHEDIARRYPHMTGHILAHPAAAKPRLPICQPHVYNRPARPCRPSPARVVRKPFFGT